MYRNHLLWILLITFPQLILGGVDPAPASGARAISLGRAYVGIGGDFWNLYHNPAGIAGIGQMQGGAFFEQRFFLRELTYGGAGLVAPFADRQAVGLSLSSFGFSSYRESMAAVAYGIRFFDKVSFGTSLHYANIAITDYGNGSAFFANVGLQYQISKQLNLGVSAYNVNRARLQTSSGEDFIPTQLTAGIAYQPSEKVLIVVDVQKDIDHPISFRGGIEYALLPALKIRSGVSTEPLTYNIGFGLDWQGAQLDVAFGVHEQLGLSPFLSLSYPFGSKS
jgi:hypothetical protein